MTIMKLWTAVNHYEATGEGVTIQALITYAKDKNDMIDKFKAIFGDYFSTFATYTEGVSNDPHLEYLFSHKILEQVKKAEGEMNIALFSEIHLNAS